MKTLYIIIFQQRMEIREQFYIYQGDEYSRETAEKI